MAELTNLENKLGEVLGLAQAAQKTTKKVGSLVEDKTVKSQLDQMHKEAAETERRATEIASHRDGKKTAIEEKARETRSEAEEMMSTYLGDDAEGLDGLEFLTMAEAGEVGHWEILARLAQRAGDQELIGLADEYDTLILEDDAYGEIRFEGEPLPSLYALDPNGRVIRAGTVSKILGAGFRLGWLCAPKAMIPVFQGFLFGGGVNPFASRVATYFLRDHMAEHVGVLVEAYRAKRDAMLKGLWEVLGKTDVEISKPEGGFFIWIKLPTDTDPKRLGEIAIRERLQYTPGQSFYANGGGERFIRLAYSYESPQRCYEGSRRIAEAILEASL